MGRAIVELASATRAAVIGRTSLSGAGWRACGTAVASSAPRAADEQRLAVRLRLDDDWRQSLGGSGDITTTIEALVARGQLEASPAQTAAANALAKLPKALSESRERRRDWDAHQQRLTAHAEEAGRRESASRQKAAAWTADGWFKGSPATPSHPNVVGPMCWLSMGRPPALQPAGCYIHGSVGSGKSTLMDLFCLFGVGELRFRRQHFHEFSLWLHENLHRLSSAGAGSPQKHILGRLVDRAVEGVDILCLDEFAVTNVADAAILAELLRLLAECNVAVICTTNRPPEDLYKDGLHRERYVPALVEHIRGSFLVGTIDGIDFRARMHHEHMEELANADATSPEPQSVFFEGGSADDAWRRAFDGDSHGPPELAPGTMKVSWGRALPVPGMGHGVASFHFNDLCRRALSAEDFLYVANQFHTIFVHDVPRLALEEHNEARRFTNLVDAVYEQSVRMICHSHVPIVQVLSSVEALRDTNSTDGHDAGRLGVFETMYDDSPNFQIQIQELGGREKWKELQEKNMQEEQRAVARRIGRLQAADAVEGDTGSGWSAAPAGSDLSAPDEGVAGVMVAAIGSLQESGFAARRAISRLKEMQTAVYLDAAKQRRNAMR